MNINDSNLTANIRTSIDGRPRVIHLAPGEVMEINSGGTTDEGYSFQGARYEHMGDYVLLEVTSDASDCDGRLTSHTTLHADLSELNACRPDQPAPWVYQDSGQRDYSAEAMGY